MSNSQVKYRIEQGKVSTSDQKQHCGKAAFHHKDKYNCTKMSNTTKRTRSPTVQRQGKLHEDVRDNNS